MSNIFYKNDFNILVKKVNNGKLCDLLSWEINSFDKEIKINNYIDNKLFLKIKNEIECEINLDDFSYKCNNINLEKLINSSLNSDLIIFLDKLNSLLKNNEIEIEKNDIEIWNPYRNLNTKKKYPFDLNLLKEKAFKKNCNNLHLSKEYLIDIIVNEIKILSDNNFELSFIENDIFNIDINLQNFNNLDDIKINIDLNSYYYPYYPPLLSFYDNFNENLENKIANLSNLKLEKWSNKSNDLLNIINNIFDFINDNVNEVIKVNEKFNFLNLLINKMISFNNIKLYDGNDLDLNLKSSTKNIWNFRDNIKNYNVKKIYELNLFDKLNNEINKFKDDDDLISYVENSNLSVLIEYYINKYNLLQLDIINNYKIFDIIFSIIKITNYNIINLNKFKILQNEILEYNDTNDELYNKIINYEINIPENEPDNDNYTNIMKQYLVYESQFKNYYFENYSCSSKVNNQCIKRITKELISYKNSIMAFNNSSIFITYNKNNCKQLMALIIGPKNTPYEYGCFIFNILIGDNYPNVPPKLYFETTNNNKIKFSPKLPIDGKVILSYLDNNIKGDETWNKEKSTLLDILISIQSKIFVKEPLQEESLYQKLSEKNLELTNEYNSKVLYNTYKYAILDKITNPNEEFKDVILNHFKLKKNDISFNIKNNNYLKDLNLDILKKLNNI